MNLKDIIEARHHADADQYKCPDCEGAGGFMRQDGPDDWDMDMCEMCSGSGRISRRDVEHLTNDIGMYKREEFVPIREARYAQDQSTQVTGELTFDDRTERDEHFFQRNVVITIDILDEDQAVIGDINAVVRDIRTTTDEKSWLAMMVGIKQGSKCWYLNDDRGEMVSGWKGKSPWALE